MGYDDLTPKHYTLELEPDIDSAVFKGTVEIVVSTGMDMRPVSVIEMDCAELDITSCAILLSPKDADVLLQSDHTVSNDTNTDYIIIPDSMIHTHEKTERLEIRLPPGHTITDTAIIKLEFNGVLNDRLLGFYRSTYTHTDNTTRHIATTQFEAADARRAFPCWDKPDAKATFAVRIIVLDHTHIAISNMPVSQITSRGSQNPGRTFHFETTPPMSTYLVYAGVGDFAITRRTCHTVHSTVTLRAITTKAIPKKATRFALECASKLLTLYESYFGIAYPLPKLDLIAIPDFAAGAMENWGAITFRESLLLYYPRTSSMRTKQRVAEVISHEIAHQWFGNLVTMKWWNDLWLNESFATYMATKLLDEIHPEWDLWGHFLTDAMRTGMELDSLKSTHPIDVPVDSPAQIREIFDPISYEKGGCILRMLEDYVGSDSFRAGLSEYLARFTHGNATGGDLWESIERHASGLPVSDMMRAWIKTPGFPAVSLARRGKNTGAVIHARQRRHDASSVSNENKKNHTRRKDAPPWPIPLSIKTLYQGRTFSEPHTTTTRMFESRTCSITTPSLLQNASRRNLMCANSDRMGFYRIEYDSDMLLDMILMADANMLSMRDLWGLENDIFAMCMAGRYHIYDYLDVASICSRTTDYAILADVTHNMTTLYHIASRLENTNRTTHDTICHHAAQMATRIFDKTAGWNPKQGEPPSTAMLRGPVIQLLGRLGHPGILRESAHIAGEIDEFLFERKKPVPVHVVLPDLVETVLSVAAWGAATRKAAGVVHDTLVKYHDISDTAESKSRILGAMCGFARPQYLIKTLDYAISSAVRSQDAFIPIVKVSENPCARGILLPWALKNWDAITLKIGRGNPLLGRVVASLANTCGTSDISQIRDHFESNPIPGTERTISQTIERISILDAMRDKMNAELADVIDTIDVYPWDAAK